MGKKRKCLKTIGTASNPLKCGKGSGCLEKDTGCILWHPPDEEQHPPDDQYPSDKQHPPDEQHLYDEHHQTFLLPPSVLGNTNSKSESQHLTIVHNHEGG